MTSKEDYYKATKTICNTCKEVYGKQTLSVILYGSIAVGDFVADPVWTDIDFLVVLKPMTERRRKEEEGRLEEVSKRIANQHPWLRGSSGYAIVGYSLETEESLIRKKLDFGYPVIWLNGVLDAYKILYSQDVLKSLQPIPIRKLDALYTLMTTRRHQIMWQTEWKRERGKKEIDIHEAMPIIKDCIFAAKNYLHYHGIHRYRKPEIVKAFVKTFPKLDRTNLLTRILKAREKRLSPKRKKDSTVLLDLAKESDQFVADLVAHLNIPILATDPRLWKDLNKLLGKASRYIYRAIIEWAIFMNQGDVKRAAQYNQLLAWLQEKQGKLEKM